MNVDQGGKQPPCAMHSYTGCVFLFWAIPFHCLTLEFAVTKLLKHTDNYSKGEDELATCFWFTSLILIPHLGSKFILKLLNTKNQTNTVNTLSCWKCIHNPPPSKKKFAFLGALINSNKQHCSSTDRCGYACWFMFAQNLQDCEVHWSRLTHSGWLNSTFHWRT